MNIIKNILIDGIEYIDGETGSVEFIDFEVCNNNWIEHRKINEALSEAEVVRVKERDKNVGQRDITSNPCYIKFFTKPKMIKFEFDNKLKFEKIRDDIFDTGWRTLDFS